MKREKLASQLLPCARFFLFLVGDRVSFWDTTDLVLAYSCPPEIHAVSRTAKNMNTCDILSHVPPRTCTRMYIPFRVQGLCGARRRRTCCRYDLQQMRTRSHPEQEVKQIKIKPLLMSNMRLLESQCRGVMIDAWYLLFVLPCFFHVSTSSNYIYMIYILKYSLIHKNINNIYL